MKLNYQLILDDIIEENINKDRVPTLLLHSCCAPCSSYVLEYLSNFFNITIYYYNPNIYPLEEYERRKKEQIRFIKEFKPKHLIKYIEGEYDYQIFNDYIKGLESELEGGNRCLKCYQLRLEEASKLAKELNFDYFTTTLSISPYKNADKINKIGKELEDKYSVKYLYADFKKRNGYKRSTELAKEYNLYRQDYCGCSYSKDNSQNKVIPE